MPEIRIKRTTLSRIYKEYKINYKVIKKVKVVLNVKILVTKVEWEFMKF